MGLFSRKSKENRNEAIHIVSTKNTAKKVLGKPLTKAAPQRSNSEGLKHRTNLQILRCSCCGSLVNFPKGTPKFKCGVCQVTTVLATDRNSFKEEAPNFDCSVRKLLKEVKKASLRNFKNSKYKG